jgi:cell division protein FtsI (penicillin-binding protein 3)
MPETVQASAASAGQAPAAPAAQATPAASAGQAGQAARAEQAKGPTSADKEIMEIAQSTPTEVKAVEVRSVPNFSGMPLRKAVEILMQKGIVPRLEGQGLIVNKQSPAPGAPWPGENKNDFVLWLSRPS